MKIKQTVILLMAVFLLLTACVKPPSTPQVLGPGLTLSMNPDVIRKGKTAEVTVHVQAVPDLTGVDIVLAYDPEILRIVDMDASTEGTQGVISQLVKPDEVDRNFAMSGVVRVAYTANTPSVTSDGPLFTFTVEALQKETTTIHFADYSLTVMDAKPFQVAGTYDLTVIVK